jgi:hypothetical protein
MSPNGRASVRPFVFPATVIIARKLSSPLDTASLSLNPLAASRRPGQSKNKRPAMWCESHNEQDEPVSAAKLLSKDEARRGAANIAKLPALLKRS